jgi:N-acylneuraminate cytidylyltransferase/CMP-N,N'-diacetyllegionaminic acid synthase
MKRLCTICARGGSKGVRNKNIRPLLGRPLIAHSIVQAQASRLFEAVAVSSDSPEILAAARQHGADILVERPADLATDSAAKVPAIVHCLTTSEERLGRRFDVLVDLDATSPLRLPEDIVGAVGLLEARGVSNVITAAPARRSPYFNLVELDRDGVVRLSKRLPNEIVRRQDAPRCFDMNASIYAWRRDVLVERAAVFLDDTLLYEMPEERSHDIDTELDFELVEFLMRRAAGRSPAAEGGAA